jgi:hypothetical protein
LFGIEHAGMGVYLNKTVHPPGHKCFAGTGQF